MPRPSRQRTLTPIVCVSTKTGVGVDELLAVLAQCVAAADGRAAHGRPRTATR